MVMSWFATYGEPKKITGSGRKSTEDIITEEISIQKDILKGIARVRKGKKTEIKSWFQNGKFSPQVNGLSFFGKELSYDSDGSPSGMEKMMKDFETAYNKGDFVDVIKDLDNRRNARDERLSSSKKG